MTYYLTHQQQEIETGIKIIQFSGEYGSEATGKTFGKSRSAVYLWNYKLGNANERLSKPGSWEQFPQAQEKTL